MFWIRYRHLLHGHDSRLAWQHWKNQVMFCQTPCWITFDKPYWHLKHHLRGAIKAVLNEDNVRTGDLGGNATTVEYTKAIVERLG